jgi:hypothetical protein
MSKWLRRRRLLIKSRNENEHDSPRRVLAVIIAFDHSRCAPAGLAVSLVNQWQAPERTAGGKLVTVAQLRPAAEAKPCAMFHKSSWRWVPHRDQHGILWRYRPLRRAARRWWDTRSVAEVLSDAAATWIGVEAWAYRASTSVLSEASRHRWLFDLSRGRRGTWFSATETQQKSL